MQIWMDGDACPKPIKNILYKAANRSQICLMVVANHGISTPPSPYIKNWQVPGGFDAADTYITDNLAIGDLVITADVPLADLVVTKGGVALNPRGELYTTNNIKQLLARRNMNEALRATQIVSSGPQKITAKNIQDFANNLDKWLSTRQKTRLS